jgi:hypothetical protein
LALLLNTQLLNADLVTLAWDANTESDLAGYKLYWGLEDGDYPNSIDVGNVTQYEIDIQSGTYVAATAYDNEDPVNESGFSDSVLYLAQVDPDPVASIITLVTKFQLPEDPPTGGRRLGEEYECQEISPGRSLCVYDSLSDDTILRTEF